ncbi:dihydropteroate synthase [Pseudoduganella sp. R-43]|uniref:dihydropteroate synthase n=1 Tax=unclassified Pseudoduganella TaxID=2637179 RepID=UPI003CF835AA
MGILNATPDSFSDGGQFASLDYAITHAEQMIRDGVDIIDIGGESSRPGAPAVPLDEELRRVMPLIFALRDCGKAISVDTYKPEVMCEAVLAGVDMINDINGFRSLGAIEAVKDSDCALCIMHMIGNPTTMQSNPEYNDVVREVTDFLAERITALTGAGIDRERLWIDPGFGFGKTVEHNYALLKAGKQMVAELGVPLLAGLSRKSMIGAITGKPVEQRLAGSIGGALAAVAHGAQIVRVHDVAETVDALRVWQAAH